MIGILDQIEVDAAQIKALDTLFTERYLPRAQQRGMTLARRWISPPLATANTPNTLWLLWELPDIAAVWAMRFRSGADPDTQPFWAAVDALCVRRERHYLVDGATLDALPQPLPLGTARVEQARGMRETTQFFLKPAAAPAAIAEWENALRVLPQHVTTVQHIALARNLEGSFLAGDFTFDAHFAAAADAAALRSHDYWREVVQPLQAAVVEREASIPLRLISGGLRQPGIRNAIKRTAYFRLLPGAPAASIARWERDILDMPVYMKGMINWSLSRSGSDDWSYVWEQEYAVLDDLLGEYMMHPHHWAHVDPWFDPEFSRQIIDLQLVHAFCSVPDSVLAWTLEPAR